MSMEGAEYPWNLEIHVLVSLYIEIRKCFEVACLGRHAHHHVR
jgi:hypothetical protein